MKVDFEQTPAKRCRKLIQETAWPELRGISDDELRQFFARMLHDEQRKLQTMDASSVPEHQYDISRNAVNGSATGLLTYGDINMVEVALASIPRKSGYGRAIMVTVLKELLPFPSQASDQWRLAEFTEWFHANLSRLRWDAEAGKFVLSD